MNQVYNYKLIFEVKENLDIEKRKYIDGKIEEFTNKFDLVKHDDGAWYKKDGFIGHADFGGVTFTYLFLEDDVEYFSKLELHDISEKKINKAC